MQGFNKVIDAFQAQSDRWILWVPVLIGLGIGGYFALPFEPDLNSGAGVLTAGVLACLWARRASPGLGLAFLAFTLIALGFTAATVRTMRVEAPVLEKKKEPVRLSGTVMDIDRLENGAFRLLLDQPELERLNSAETPARVRVTVRTDKNLPTAGDRVGLLAGLLPISAPVEPGGFDFQRMMYFQRIGATGYALSPVTIIEKGAGAGPLENFRQKVSDRIHAAIPDPRAAGVTTALLINEQGEIGDDDWRNIRNSGLAHLIAISGMHIGIVAGFVFFVVRALLALSERAALYWPIKKIAAVAAILAAVGYTLVAGAPVPAQRSVLMIGMVMLAIILDRDPFSLRLAAFAATVILLLAPEMLLGASFQMSFSAVVALIAFYESLSDKWSQWARERSWLHRFGLYLAGSMLTTVVASIATAPFSLYHFQQTPLWASLVANMAAVPLTVFIIMPAGFIGLLLVPIGLDGIFFKVAGLGNGLILDLAERLAETGFSVLYVTAWPVAGFVTVIMGMLWVVIWRGWLRACGVLPVAAGVVILMLSPGRPDVLMSENGKLAAVRNDAGALVFSTARGEKFVRTEWLRRDGVQELEEIPVWPRAGGGERENVTCDAQGCIYRKNGHVVAFPQDRAALIDDCKKADVVIAADFGIKRHDCQARIVVDRWDLWRNGAYALWLDVEGVIVRAANPERGARPWVRVGGDMKKNFRPQEMQRTQEE